MSQIISSAYAGLAKLLLETDHFISPAELQGALWGRIVMAANADIDTVLADMTVILGEGTMTPALKQAVSGLHEMHNKELYDGSVAVTLLLPDDETPIHDRLKAVIEWGQGFLTGFGMVKVAQELSADVLEILQDIAAITQLELKVSSEDEARSEGDYMELVEFLRVVPLLVATELNMIKPLEKGADLVSKSVH